MSTAKLNATGQRWASELRDYPIPIYYKDVIQTKVADCLRRLSIETTVQHQVLSTDEIKAILSPVKNQGDNEEVLVAVLAVTKQPETDCKEVFSDKCVSSIYKCQPQQLQHVDPVIRFCRCVKKKPPHIKPVAPLGTVTAT